MRGDCQPTRAGGYTMPELIVVIAVVAIAAALAAPMLGQTAGTRLASAARMLAADIDQTRIATLTRADRPTVLVFADDGSGYHLARAETPDTPIDHPIDPGPYVITFGHGRAASLAGVTIHSLDFDDAPTLAFGRFGHLPQPEPATITLADDGRTLTLTIHPTSGEVAIGELE
ncbi:MAG: prepilin-type N-terminal cleavage/methylation domain-containing protein [Phycisphaeraceae bacterium]